MGGIGASWFETALTRLLTTRRPSSRRLPPPEGPADPQQRLPPGHEPLERPRHFRHQAGKSLRDIRWRRADRIGSAPDHEAAGFVELRQAQPWRPFRRFAEKMRTSGIQRD